MGKGGRREGAGRKPSPATRKRKSVMVRIDEELLARIDDARAPGASMSAVVEQLIRIGLDRYFNNGDESTNALAFVLREAIALSEHEGHAWRNHLPTRA